ncbi:hypothetical protein D3C73_1435160 [compost metagenome]
MLSIMREDVQIYWPMGEFYGKRDMRSYVVNTGVTPKIMGQGLLCLSLYRTKASK